jgi:hypothetical protein
LGLLWPGAWAGLPEGNWPGGKLPLEGAIRSSRFSISKRFSRSASRGSMTSPGVNWPCWNVTRHDSTLRGAGLLLFRATACRVSIRRDTSIQQVRRKVQDKSPAWDGTLRRPASREQRRNEPPTVYPRPVGRRTHSPWRLRLRKYDSVVLAETVAKPKLSNIRSGCYSQIDCVSPVSWIMGRPHPAT